MSQEKVSVSANEFRRFKLNVPIPMGCAIITTVDVQGRVNAALFATVFPWQNNQSRMGKKGMNYD
jgi:flavin reductase (DIM6/NTAB) family NADH-FMN oxidoreductase RutF